MPMIFSVKTYGDRERSRCSFFLFFDIVELNFIGVTPSPELKDRFLNIQYIFWCNFFLSSPETALYKTKGKVIIV